MSVAEKIEVREHVGKYEKLCFERHEKDLDLCKKRGSRLYGHRYDETRGERVIKFVEDFCCHYKGEWAGKPMLLEEWQKRIIRIAYGWLKPDGTRRFRTHYVEVGRKNGKSAVAAALGLYLVVADGEPGAEVYSSATKKDQAKIVWKTAQLMVKKSPELRRFVEPLQNSLHVPHNESFFQPLSSEANTLDGLNPHGNIVDELHAHKDRALWDVLASAMGSRRQPVTLAITTAGVSDQHGIGYQTHDYACKVLDGTFEDDEFFAFIASCDEGDDYFGDVALQKANPNWGISVKPSWLRKRAADAQVKPDELNEYLVKNLNVWTQQVRRWLAMDRWDACEETILDPADARTAAVEREAKLSGRICFGGLDLSSKLDLTALALSFDNPDGSFDLIMRFWLPRAAVDAAAKKGMRHYQAWEKAGWLTVTDGNIIDYEFIRKEVLILSKRHRIKEISYDPWGAIQISTQLTSDGITMVECGQGYKSMSEPSKEVEAKVVDKKVRHALNPILRWCAQNAVVVRDPAGNIKPDKESAVEKIDGVVAVVMARSRAIRLAPAKGHAYSGGQTFRSL